MQRFPVNTPVSVSARSTMKVIGRAIRPPKLALIFSQERRPSLGRWVNKHRCQFYPVVCSGNYVNLDTGSAINNKISHRCFAYLGMYEICAQLKLKFQIVTRGLKTSLCLRDNSCCIQIGPLKPFPQYKRDTLKQARRLHKASTSRNDCRQVIKWLCVCVNTRH